MFLFAAGGRLLPCHGTIFFTITGRHHSMPIVPLFNIVAFQCIIGSESYVGLSK